MTPSNPSDVLNGPHDACTALCVPGIGFHVRPTVIWWAKQTELVLQNNDHKGGWLDPEWPTIEAVRRLKEEVAELEQAVLKGADISDVVREASDVSNFAMMIGDRARRGLP